MSACFCAGRNPGFKGPPVVEQVRLDRVRVSWGGLVTKEACADNFIVKYWQRLFPRDYRVTRLVHHRSEVEVEVVPKVIYHFQVGGKWIRNSGVKKSAQKQWQQQHQYINSI